MQENKRAKNGGEGPCSQSVAAADSASGGGGGERRLESQDTQPITGPVPSLLSLLLPSPLLSSALRSLIDFLTYRTKPQTTSQPVSKWLLYSLGGSSTGTPGTCPDGGAGASLRFFPPALRAKEDGSARESGWGCACA